MSIQGWYYLHVSGDLIFKRDLPGTAADIRESDFARGLWAYDSHDREGAWTICVEALAAGAKPERIRELAAKWWLDDTDADIYAERVGAGIDVVRDGDRWCATPKAWSDFILIQRPAGFGPTKLEAFADLAKALGYAPSKMWGASFRDLLLAHRNGKPEFATQSPDAAPAGPQTEKDIQ